MTQEEIIFYNTWRLQKNLEWEVMEMEAPKNDKRMFRITKEYPRSILPEPGENLLRA
jgi:hypothetical protein